MNVIETLISSLAPHKCIVCGINGELLCEACRLSALNSPPPRCYRCHTVSSQSRVCQRCKKHTVLGYVWVAANYQDIAKELLHRLKFERASAASAPVAAAIEQVLPDLPSSTLVVHVPTANKRVRVRGYDQAKLIAEKLSSKRNWKPKVLLMRRGGSRQVGSGRLDRLDQISTVFIPLRQDVIKNAKILLIDDVTTTGATIEAAAKILKKAGAKSVDAAVFAQAS